MNAIDVDAIERSASMRSCGTCGDDSAHFRGCADCKFTIARCDNCGGNKAASREMFLHRQREHGVQLQLGGTATPPDPVLEATRPRLRADCEPCAVCQAWFDGDVSAQMSANGALLCGHTPEQAPNHCRPCPWVGCRHHVLIEIAKAKPRHSNGKPRDARPTTIRLNIAPEVGKLGRRSGLHAQDPVDVVQRWIDRAIDRLEDMEHSCSLDVADANTDGYPLVSVAELLGVTAHAIKQEVGPAGEALRVGLKEYEDHVPADHTGTLAQVQGR